MQVWEKVGKSQFTAFFKWFVAPEGRKVGSLKGRVRRHLARWEMTNCTPLWHEAHLEIKMFWKLRCRKSARGCGAKHMSKSKCTKHLTFRALLEVDTSKKCTRLWREAHVQVKMSPSQEISALTSEHLWWTCLLYCACHRKCIFADPLQMSHACQHLWNCYKTVTFCSLLTRCTIPCACHAEQHLNVQKWSKHVFFKHFDLEWLGNVLCTTTACTFSTCQLPKVLWTWGALYTGSALCMTWLNFFVAGAIL